MRRRLSGVCLYPFLMASYPALALLAANVEQVGLQVVIRPLLLALLLCAVLYALLMAVLRRGETAALLTTLWLALFFSYGHVYYALRQVPLIGESLGRHRYLGVAWLVLAIAASAWIVRRRTWGQPNRLLNAVLAIAVALPLVQLVAFAVEGRILAARVEAGGSKLSAAGILPEDQVLTPPADQLLPDIYYIILDGYGRSDTLKDVYGYDNAEFREGLRRLGFVVAECAQSNYAQTDLSIASSTNLLYLEPLGVASTEDSTNRRPLSALVRSSAVRRSLEALGYRTVAFDTGYSFINLQDADLYLSPALGTGLSGFELLFLRSTAGLIALDSATLLPQLLAPGLNYPQEAHRARVLYAFDELEGLGRTPGPKFVYAHIVSPHDPFVFGPGGEPVSAAAIPTAAGTEWELQAYSDQVRFISKRALSMLEALIAGSERPAVVLLQADHGPGWNSAAGRMGILSAYRFPGAEAMVTPGITPVNSFRVLFNGLFGTSFAMLPDISYFSTYDAPFDFTMIPTSCPSQVTP
ncbi:MAG: LTA synthase family protein [Chloroflexi bacterium]|nr:LTA synthase family protein [Chloroflexota bacterium]